MAQPRSSKRARKEVDQIPKPKRLRTSGNSPPTSRDMLSRYYPTVVTLREYLLSRLPPTSRMRKKKLARLGTTIGVLNEVETTVCHFLDTTLVGVTEKPYDQSEERWQEWVTFSQKNDDSHVSLTGDAAFSQSEVRQARLLCDANL